MFCIVIYHVHTVYTKAVISGNCEPKPWKKGGVMRLFPSIYSVALGVFPLILFVVFFLKKNNYLKWKKKKMSYFSFDSYVVLSESHFLSISNSVISIHVIRTLYQPANALKSHSRKLQEVLHGLS